MAQPAGKDSVSVASSCPPDNIRPACAMCIGKTRAEKKIQVMTFGKLKSPGQRSGWQEVASWVRLLVVVVAVLVVVVAWASEGKVKVKKRKMAPARAILKTAIWPVRWMKYCKMVYLILLLHLHAPFELPLFTLSPNNCNSDQKGFIYLQGFSVPCTLIRAQVETSTNRCDKICTISGLCKVVDLM